MIKKSTKNKSDRNQLQTIQNQNNETRQYSFTKTSDDKLCEVETPK